MNFEVAFLTTIFPMPEEYLDDFFSSLLLQTNRMFDVIVVNDGYEYFDDIIKKYNDLNIVELKFSGTPSKNREFGIKYCIQQSYKVLIFGDSDDCFKENRVEVCVEKLTNYDVVVNDLTLFDENGIICEDYISNRVESNTEISLGFIEEKNIFGMTNTSIKVSVVSEVLFEEDLVAVDWYFFTVLLLSGCKALFTAETGTLYRQAQENTIGLKQATKESLRKGLSVKLRHYELLAKKDERYKKYLQEIKNVSVKYNDDRYLSVIVNSNTRNPLWWEEVRGLRK